MSLSDFDGTAVAPGDRICRSDDAIVAGYGTHEYHNWIHSSLLGRVTLSSVGVATEEQQDEASSNGKTVVKVESNNATLPPTMVDAIVVAQVVRVTSRVAHCSLLACNGLPLHAGFKGHIRKEDVRATERDRVDLADCFRAGDIVQARVLTLGQNLTYLLSTAQNELGVVLADGQHGCKLVPVSWTEMKCPISGQAYKRKVAKVPEEFVTALVQHLLRTGQAV